MYQSNKTVSPSLNPFRGGGGPSGMTKTQGSSPQWTKPSGVFGPSESVHDGSRAVRAYVWTHRESVGPANLVKTKFTGQGIEEFVYLDVQLVLNSKSLSVTSRYPSFFLVSF